MVVLDGFQKPVSQPGKKEVRLAVLHTDGIYRTCSCGWAYGAERKKVRDDAAQRHLDRKHKGRGLWL